MNVDDVKERAPRSGEGLQGLMELARRSVPERRRIAETLEPLRDRRALALVQQAREKLDWTRLPGIRTLATHPSEKLQVVLAKRVAAFVLLPTALMAFYFYVIAADQYVVQTQFAVRGDLEPMGQVVGSEFASLIEKHNSQDSFIVRDFINSRAMAEVAEKTLQVSQIFSREEGDFWTRFRAPKPIEKLVKHWREHVHAQIEQVSGIVTLTVRTYRPEDSLAISELAMARSEKLVNEISARAQAAMIRSTEKDAQAAETRMRNARLALQGFRNTWGIIDPIKTAENTLLTIGLLRKDKLKAENDLQVLRDSKLDEKSRGIQVLVATLGAIDGQIKRLQDQLTTDGLAAGASNNITQALLEYEGLKIEVMVAEKLHESMNLLLERARISAARQQVYLATIVPPEAPASSEYPKRGQSLLISLFCFFVLWSSASLIHAGAKDQRL